jgi:hypothetical protein
MIDFVLLVNYSLTEGRKKIRGDHTPPAGLEKARDGGLWLAEQ